MAEKPSPESDEPETVTISPLSASPPAPASHDPVGPTAPPPSSFASDAAGDPPSKGASAEDDPDSLPWPNLGRPRAAFPQRSDLLAKTPSGSGSGSGLGEAATLPMGGAPLEAPAGAAPEEAASVAVGWIEHPTTGMPPVSSMRDGIDDLRASGSVEPPRRPGLIGIIDHYELLRKLGEGGMGVVLLARDTKTDTMVALKTIRPRFAAVPQAQHRFVVEAKHMRGMNHPSVLKVLDVCERATGAYYVMPYVPTGSLSSMMEPDKPLATQIVLKAARQIADALRYAHDEKGVIHRDIKLQNVLIDQGGNALLADFGLVRTVFNDTVMDNERSSWTVGTGPYMAPEIVAGKAGDTRADVYSFGAMLYEMATGRPPFLGESTEEILTKIKLGPPPPVMELNPALSPGLAKVIEGAMGRELRDRYAHMADVSEDLRRVEIGQAPLEPHGVSRKEPVVVAPKPIAPEPEPLPSINLLPIAAAIILIVLAGLAIGLGFMYWHHEGRLVGSVTPPESNKVVVPDSSKVVVPDLSKVAAPDSNKVVAPDSSKVVVPNSNKVVVPDLSKVAAPDSSKVVVPNSNKVVVPDSSKVVVPDSNKVVVPDSNKVVVPDSNKVVAPDSSKVVVPDSNKVVMPDSNKVVVPDSNKVVAPDQKKPPAKTRVPVTAIKDAIQRNDIVAFEEMLTGDVDLNARLPDGTTLLNYAISSHQPKQAIRLIEGGARTDILDQKHNSYAYLAATLDQGDVITALHNHHADIDSPNPDDGHTPLYAAIFFRRPAALKALLDAGADLDRRVGSETLRSLAQSKGNSAIQEIIARWKPNSLEHKP